MSFTGHPDFARLNSIVGPPLVALTNFGLTGAFTSAVFPVAEYDTLEVWNPVISAATGFRISFVWWSAMSGGAQLGGTTQCHTVNGKPFRVSIPVAGPFVQVVIEAFSYATTPLITVTIFPRVGVKPTLTGGGDNNLVTSASPFVAAGGAQSFQAFIVCNVRATIVAQSDQATLLGYVIYTLFDTTTRVLAVLQPQGINNFYSMEVQLPTHVITVILANTAAVAATLNCSVVAHV